MIASSFNKIVSGYNKNDLVENIDDLIIRVHDRIYEDYKSYEEKEASRAIKKYFENEIDIGAVTNDRLLEVISSRYSELNTFTLSLSQARKSRAGKTFEKILYNFFNKLSIPFSFQPEVDGRPDFIIPGIDDYHNTPQDCLVITAKRTVRERWRQVATEGARGYRFMLATIDDKISKNALNKMRENQITLVIPEQLISDTDHYSSSNIIISYKKLFSNYIVNTLSNFQ